MKYHLIQYLTGYINKGNILLAFRGVGNFFPGAVRLINVIVNPELKAKQFMVTPNPARDNITVQFYPQPNDLKAIILYSGMGQQLNVIRVTGAGSSHYSFDLKKYSPGVYIVSAVFSDRILNKKIVKLK